VAALNANCRSEGPAWSFRTGGGYQLPGDATQNGQLELNDAIELLGIIFIGPPYVYPCSGTREADPDSLRLLNFTGNLDTQGKDSLQVSDAIGLLERKFFLGAPPHLLGEQCILFATCPDVCPP
jgi:hypothetical protein